MLHSRNHPLNESGTRWRDDRRMPYNRNGFYSKSRNSIWGSNDYRINFNRFNWSNTPGNEFMGSSSSNTFSHPGIKNLGGQEPSFKRRKNDSGACGDGTRRFYQHNAGTLRCNSLPSTSVGRKRFLVPLHDEEPVFMSRADIDRFSPSRKDGIDALRETHLRYSYCAFLQDLGMRLDLPQTTIGTAMVLCHRFFVRRSHACHDRFLIATATLFLAAKSEETPQPLNNVVRCSCEIFYKQDVSLLSYVLPVDWFEKYRERVIEAEHMILATLNFDLNVQHPYASLTSVLERLGLSETLLVTLSLNLLSEGLRSSLWLQFRPHHIASGAAFLAAKLLNMDLSPYRNIWQEFDSSPAIIHDVSQQLMELF